MLKPAISASMMCANFIELKSDLDALKDAGIEYLHFDIMDGSFVPNYTLGPCFLNDLREYTDIAYDIHLMVERPENKLDYFSIREGDLVSIHCESTAHIQRVLTRIKQIGAKAGAAINPGTPIYMLEDILDDIDFVLVMTVNPGFAGQKLINHSLDKIRKVRCYLDENGYKDVKIEVDGNVSFENARKMRAAGADIFVAGTSGLFVKGQSIYQAALKLRSAITE